ncbi:LOW QUALITY PROTEIN: envoplakin [Callorhinchus milii]|uniref:LOW QUALITY PROTEIN: envoplakin n=1 Tax=Callorhinchus milii TaxID=7868 RepID=UPI001C3FAE64|nr:LOW QUALITY PROTEIN: envoplakin [Callorhinchus milii]
MSKYISPQKVSRTQSNEMLLLISRLQSNGDQVEHDILSTENKLQADKMYLAQKKPFRHQEVIKDSLSRSEELLRDMFMDADKVGRLKHPQSKEIENDVKKMHERWAKQCSEYRDMYEKLELPKDDSSVDWPRILEQKQREISAGQYGPQLPELEKQIGEHNILSRELESYGPKINSKSVSNPDELKRVQKQYQNLQDQAKKRKQELNTVYDYIQGCSKQLMFLNEQEEKIQKLDWSDRMMNPEEVRRQYESFKKNGLLEEEDNVNKIQENGNRLIELKHPGSPAIEAHKEAVRNDWQQFLNLCICQEAHLKNVEDYRKFQRNAEALDQTIKKHDAELDTKFSKYKSSPYAASDLLQQFEADEKKVIDMYKDVNDLKKQSGQVMPLKSRRTPVSKPMPVSALCDWGDDPKSEINRGEKLVLRNNNDNDNWVVATNNGQTKKAPGVCFSIPPPDPEALAQVNRLEKEINNLKKKRETVEKNLKKQQVEKDHLSQTSLPATNTAPSGASDTVEKHCKELLPKLDKINADIDRTEKALTNQLHTPVNRTAAPQDLNDRLKDQQHISNKLQDIGRAKEAAQRDCEAILAKKPTSSSVPLLSDKLNKMKNNYKDATELVCQAQDKTNAQLKLESDIKKVDDVLKPYELNLAEEMVVPASPNAIQDRQAELQRLKQNLDNDQDSVQTLNQSLKKTDQSCKALQLNFQEFCPDFKSQQADVQHLNTRYNNIRDQLERREAMIENADSKYNNLKSSEQNLNSFMKSLPVNQLNPMDSLRDTENKLRSQEKVVADIKKKEPEKNATLKLSQDLQSALNDFEKNSEKYRATLDDSNKPITKKQRIQPLQDVVQEEEKVLASEFAKVSSLNQERLKQLRYATEVKAKQEDSPISQTVQNNKALFATRNMNDLKEEMIKEAEKIRLAEADLKEQKEELQMLKIQRPVDMKQEKEVVDFYRDPKTETDLNTLRTKIHEERKKRQNTEMDKNGLVKKLRNLEDKQNSIVPNLLIKEVTRLEKDPLLDVEAENLRNDINMCNRETQLTEGELDHLKRQISNLEKTPVNVVEKVVVVEKVKVEKDPEMLRASRNLQNQIDEEDQKRQTITNNIRSVADEIDSLEHKIRKITPKVIIKEIQKIEKDPELQKESSKLRKWCEDERQNNALLSSDLNDLQKAYNIVNEKKLKVEVKEIVRENFRVAPETEKEIVDLKKEIQELLKRKSQLEIELTLLKGDLNVLKDQQPHIEYKEIVNEVEKLQKTPEMLNQIDHLNNELNKLSDTSKRIKENINDLKDERDDWRKRRNKVETKVVTKDVVKYLNDPILEKEAESLRKEVRDESQKRRDLESLVFDLQQKYLLIERQKPKEKTVVQETVRLQKDPKIIREHDNLGKNLDDERRLRRNLDREVQNLKALLKEKEAEINLEEERSKKLQSLHELNRIKDRIYELETAPPPVEERIVTEEVLKIEKDPLIEKACLSYRRELEDEKNKIVDLEQEKKRVEFEVDLLHREKSQEKTIYKEVVRVTKDKALEEERSRARDQYNKEKNSRLDVLEEIRRLKERLQKLDDMKRTHSREEAELKKMRDANLHEKDALEDELKDLENEKEQKTSQQLNESKLMSRQHEKEKEKRNQLGNEVTALERDIIKENDKLHDREYTVRDLQSQINREEARHRDTQLRETNLSTKITILDSETGKDLSPYEAYKRNLIDREQYIQLQELECDWEEISTLGPSGVTSVLRDKKSGKHYSIEDALKNRKITKEELYLYREGKIPISEFALLVAGEDKPKTLQRPALKQTDYTPHIERDKFPIAGVYDTMTNSKLSINSGLNRKLIDPLTAQKILEAQAATGGIIDVGTRERFSVSQAVDKGLIDRGHMQRLLNAQKAFTGVEDPMTGERLPVGLALKNGWLPAETALRYLEAQHLTGGLVDPNKSGRVSIRDALQNGMIDSNTARMLQEESNYVKDLIDPMTNERIHYREMMERCQKDELSGLLLIPAASSEQSSYQPNSRFDYKPRYTSGY